MIETLKEELSRIESLNLLRTLKEIENPQKPISNVDSKNVILLCTNNYLGLSDHPDIKKAAKMALDEFGTGAGASRLISGNCRLYKELEDEIATFKGTEASIVFPTGYMANVGTISSVVGKDDLILSDELNHASIVDGCKLSRARVFVYRHRDTNHIEYILKKEKPKRALIVTDGVFSMDGDIAPLPEICELVNKYGVWLMVDDAHATGVIGENGKGTFEYFGIDGSHFIQMGTLSKALGALGGYVAGPKALIDYLINRARSFIFTTALPPSVLACAKEALKILKREGKNLRKKLFKNVNFLKNGLLSYGFEIYGDSHIIPLIIGDEKTTLNFSRMLFENGVFVPAIRPPTVPKGRCRLRITVQASHSKDDLENVLQIFKRVGKKLGII